MNQRIIAPDELPIDAFAEQMEHTITVDLKLWVSGSCRNVECETAACDPGPWCEGYVSPDECLVYDGEGEPQVVAEDRWDPDDRVWPTTTLRHMTAYGATVGSLRRLHTEFDDKIGLAPDPSDYRDALVAGKEVVVKGLESCGIHRPDTWPAPATSAAREETA